MSGCISQHVAGKWTPGLAFDRHTIFRPVHPMLQAAGIKRLSTRKEWPVEVLKQVLGSLMREVPKDLLERQIWSGSASSNDWWNRHRQHSRSTAVMCMVSPFIRLVNTLSIFPAEIGYRTCSLPICVLRTVASLVEGKCFCPCWQSHLRPGLELNRRDLNWVPSFDKYLTPFGLQSKPHKAEEILHNNVIFLHLQSAINSM